ncbi:ABC-2 type transport system ATP-binding protein [Stackebrandtia albiflava]|uniref:ABC-2 type transport system ATP-binding protein n=1 Tax=Stackebrandtia albiflava TaxID=406432 RepID=A0A562UL94_9ACTN|nr:ABC transporter ATP-binding protein [Stackebrandtia albiflava]TWJ06384.1 ABC-2 type transport system ATP-binding protein [Stackebrandtia albiflava]
MPVPDSDVAALETIALDKRYRRVHALSECSFSLPSGRIAALAGPNGAGKSTLMDLIAGIRRPTGGEIRVLGTSSRSFSGIHPDVSYLAQRKPLYRSFTVEEMLKAGHKLNDRWDAEYARRLVEQAGLTPKAKVSTLSGGQRSRLAIAMALGRRPAVLLLDEPLAELDPFARREVSHALLDEVRNQGTTVLMSSHIVADLQGMCDYLLCLVSGRLVLDGPVEELLGAHRVRREPDLDGAAGSTVSPVVEAAPASPETEWRAPTLEELVLSRMAPPPHGTYVRAVSS